MVLPLLLKFTLHNHSNKDDLQFSRPSNGKFSSNLTFNLACTGGGGGGEAIEAISAVR